MLKAKKVLALAIAVIVVCASGYVAAAKVWGFSILGLAAEPGDQRPQKTCVISLGQFTTNLVDYGRFVRVTVDLEIYSSKAQEITGMVSELKTDIYALLRSKSYAELGGESGLRALQRDMREILSRKCPGAVSNVYFAEFLIQ